jgi:hypothetical protein
MKHNSVYIFLILILAGYSIYETVLFYKIKHTAADFSKLIENKEIESDIKLNNVDLFLDMIFFESDNFTIFADDIIAKYNIENKLIFSFSQETCTKCVLDILADIDTILLKTLQPQNIVLICQSSNENPFDKEEFKTYRDRFKCIWINYESSFKPLLIRPYFFIATPKTTNKHIYIPELLPIYKKKYYLYIVTTFFKSNNYLKEI